MVLNSDKTTNTQDGSVDVSVDAVNRLLQSIKSETESDESSAQPISSPKGERLTDSTINGYVDGENNRPFQNVNSPTYKGSNSEEIRGRSDFRNRGGQIGDLARQYPSTDFDKDYIVEPNLNRLQDYDSSPSSYFDDNPRFSNLNGRRYMSGTYDDTLPRYKDGRTYQTGHNPFQDADYGGYKNGGPFKKESSQNVRINSRKKSLGRNWQVCAFIL